MVMFGKSAKTWDSSFRVPLTDEVWFDANDANRAIARSVYDMTTGNVTQHFKPKQNAAGSTSTSLTYDARKLFATTAINEAGHQLDFTFEYGTGMKLQSDGPNARACTSNCPSGATFPVKEEHKIRIDGLGRELEKWDTFSDDGNIYTLYQTQLTSYVDVATGSVPTSVFHQTRFDTAATFWKQEKTELDGHGRPFRKTVFAQGSAPNDEITSFFYSNDGTLKAVSVPDPTQNNASVVTYTYGFDSLGRPISIRRPDALSLTDQSGVNMAYDGVTKTVTEVVGTAGGNAASTTTIGDKLGRLVEVREKTGATTFAATHYTYGPDDLVTSVVDPDGVTTLLTHDFAGHRTQIERANGRKWKYGYDKNGNVVSEQVPGSPNPPFTDILYTTTIAYDDLDRVASKVIGQRNLSAADQALFASGTETYTWDYGPNHKGFLRYWQSFAPGSSTAAITVDAYNNNQGQRTLTKETLNIAGYPTLQQQFIRSYHLFGGVASTSYRDWVGGSNQTSSLTNYDKRLLPLEMVLQRSGMAAQTIGTQTRNVAGLVTKRRTNTTGPMTFVESNWTYDKLARVTSQVVQKGPGPTQVARQDLAYLGNDDPSSLDHYLGTTRRHFQYGFDFRHQITSAIETTTPGYFSGTYAYGSPTSSGRLTHVTESQTSVPFGSEVMPRDVNYQYAGTDPEEVTALVNASGSSQGQSFASYTFDASGNQITRCYGAATTPTCAGESLEFVYDGKGHLRRATSKQDGVVQGSEEYWYGASGDRISILKRDAAGTKLEMVWFVADSEAHFDATGVISHVYSHLSLGTPVARVDRTENAATLVEYQFHGLSTNAIAAVDQLGVINCSFTYSPFGTVVQGTDDGGDASGIQRHARRLNDKYQDVISSLHYYGARFYDAIGQQWTQADPLMLRVPDVAQTVPRRAHLYAFALQNPLRYQDPDGLDSVATQLVSQSMLCMKSSTGAGCVLDSGAAVYDGETEWLRSGGSLLAGVARGIDDSFSEASRGVIDAPSPVFAGGGVMVDPKTGAIIRTGDPKFFDDLSQVVEWIRDRGEEVAVRYVIRRLVGGVIAGVTEEDNSRDAPDASLTGKEREDYLNRKRAMSQGAGPKDVLSRGTRMGGGKNSQGGGAPDPEPEPPPPPLQGWQCNGPGSVCGGNPGPFKNPSAPFNTLCYWCFLKTAQRPPTGEDTR